MNTIWILVLLIMGPNGGHDVGVQLDDTRRPMLFQSEEDCNERAKHLLNAAQAQVPWAQARCWAAPQFPSQEMLDQREQKLDNDRPTRVPNRI